MKTNHIQPGNYVGYLWYSDKTAPDVLNGVQLTDVLRPDENPFVIEGQLWDETQQVSYSIRYVVSNDGQQGISGHYVIQQWNLKNDFPTSDFDHTELEALPNQAFSKEAGKLLFRRYWKAEKDELCEDMKVLNPHALVFVGFKNRKETTL